MISNDELCEIIAYVEQYGPIYGIFLVYVISADIATFLRRLDLYISHIFHKVT